MLVVLDADFVGTWGPLKMKPTKPISHMWVWKPLRMNALLSHEISSNFILIKVCRKINNMVSASLCIINYVCNYIWTERSNICVAFFCFFAGICVVHVETKVWTLWECFFDGIIHGNLPYVKFLFVIWCQKTLPSCTIQEF